MNKWIVHCLTLALCIPSVALGIFPINVFRPWDLNLRPLAWPETHKQGTAYYEAGLKVRAYDAEKDSENVLQIWTPTQDALAMLQGFPGDSPLTTYYTTVLLSPIDNGVRGNLQFNGHFDMKASAGLGFYYHFPHYVTLIVGLPLYAMSLTNVVFNDLTQTANAADMRVKNFLTNNFVGTLAQLDPTLDINGWRRSGIGDLGILAEWRQGFRQTKQYLRNVELALRLGLTLPTGLKRNVNQILSVPFGYESVGLIIGGGIKLTWWNWLRGGVDFELLQLFGTTGHFRVKVHEDQTDFLFLAQAKAHKEFGITQRYNLCLETLPLVRGFSLGVAYEFWKHGRDKYDLLAENYSQKIANTAQSLQEWTMHQLIFKAWYDCSYDIRTDRSIKPQFLLFYKLPINGKRSLMLQSIGAQLTLSF